MSMPRLFALLGFTSRRSGGIFSFRSLFPTEFAFVQLDNQANQAASVPNSTRKITQFITHKTRPQDNSERHTPVIRIDDGDLDEKMDVLDDLPDIPDGKERDPRDEHVAPARAVNQRAQHDEKENLPPISQLDRGVMECLPSPIQREVVRAYEFEVCTR